MSGQESGREGAPAGRETRSGRRPPPEPKKVFAGAIAELFLSREVSLRNLSLAESIPPDKVKIRRIAKRR
jgi:hypothetical protein